jgi:tetratricopeptide (TPR) repeat protein
LAVLSLIVVGFAWFSFNRPDPDRVWAQGQMAVRAGRLDEARAALVRIERLRPKKAVDWLLEAQLASAHSRTDEALAALVHISAGDPMAAQAELFAGRLERARKRLRAAEAHFQSALRSDPGLIDAHRELVYVYGIQARRREADAEFHALGRLTSLTHHDLFTWALTHFTSWRPDVAEDLQAFIDADRDDRNSRLALAETLHDQPEQGKRVLRILDALPSTDSDALSIRVSLAIHEERLDEARSLLETGPADHPGLARFRGRLAMLANDPAAAVEHFRRALSSEPYDRVALFDLGQALSLTGNKDEAEHFLERAKRLNELYNLVVRVRSPSQENVAPDLIRLASACEAAGLTEEARHWYLLAVSRDPLDAKAQQGLFRLEHYKTAPAS